MNRTSIIWLVVAVIVVGGGVFLFAQNSNSNHAQLAQTSQDTVHNSTSHTNQSTPTNSQSSDPCTLLTTAKINDAFSVNVGDGKRTDASPSVSCEWKDSAGPGERFTFSDDIDKVDIKNFDSFRQGGSAYNQYNTYENTPSKLGDDSAWFTTSSVADSTVSLVVLKGGNKYQFTAYRGNGLDKEATRTAMFKLVSPLFQ